MDTPEVTLRTGAKVPKPAVTTTHIALRRLLEVNPVAFWEAAGIARDAGHVPFGDTGKIMRDIGLLGHDGQMHDVTRDVILASVEGEGPDMRLVSPYPAPEVAG